MNRRAHARASVHARIGVLSTASVVGWMVIRDRGHWTGALATGSGYVALALLGAVFLVGPLRRSRAAHLDLRRDLGIWAGMWAAVHTAAGMFTHLRAAPRWVYFFHPTPGRELGALRVDAFGWANHSGVVAALILAVPWLLSNDLSLRRLGVARWRRLQRWSLGAAVVTLVHTALYQVVASRPSPWVVLTWALVAAVITVRWRRRARS